MTQFIETGDRSEYGIERQRLRFSVSRNKKYSEEPASVHVVSFMATLLVTPDLTFKLCVVLKL